MKSNTRKRLQIVPAVALGFLLLTAVTSAQTTSTDDKSKSTTPPPKAADKTPTSTTTGDDAGDYIVTSSIELGYRGIRVDGDEMKYRSDLNYKAGPRIFDSSFLMKSKDGKGGLFDTLLVTATGWGADPTSSLRISVEKPEWYRFEGSYRRAKYYRFLNNIANPNWLFSGFPVPPNPTTGLHGYNTRTEFGDFDLTILPKNEWIRFNVGFSPEHYEGPFFSTYHIGGNEFQTLVNSDTRARDLRFGADGRIGKVDWTFMQGFRRFHDDSTIDTNPAFLNPNPSVARYTSFQRSEPTHGRVDYTRASIHTFLANRLDITGRIIYSKATSNSTFLETSTGTNFNTRISGQPGPPNTLLLGAYNIPSSAGRPNTLGDVGVTFFATDKLKISNTFRVEDFSINGVATFNDIFSVRTSAGVVDTRRFSFLQAFKTTDYRKYQNILEGDYQFTRNYSMHLGYRYGNRREEQTLSGYALGSNAPTPINPPEFESEENHTHAIFGGFRARPTKNWTVYFDAEHGTADNVFTRIGNYDYTNIRAKSRYTPNPRVNFNVAFISRDNANPSEIAGENVSDFGASTELRTFQSSIDWIATPNLTLNFGYNYNFVDTDATIDYYYQVPPASSVFHHFGHALYFMRNNFFYVDTTWRFHRRATLYTSFRINRDNGQGDRLSDPAGGTPIPGGIVVGGSTRNPANEGGTLITSYPMSFMSPETRLAIRVNRHLDWNLGYQYFGYNEDDFFKSFPPASGRPQNYHAHLPYMSLRLYFGRKE
jgi:hypothetical protein